MLSEGLQKEIATQLGIGYSTVDTHVSHIYRKLRVSNAPPQSARRTKAAFCHDGNDTHTTPSSKQEMSCICMIDT